MADFSWSDSIRAALSPCLACLQTRTDNEGDDEEVHNHGPDHVRRARYEELEGLLADADDAETLSLHSNLGQEGRRKKRTRKPKSIRLFGFDLFGRPAIQLPDDDEEESTARRIARDSRARTRTISASTLDSDAAPLDPSTIAQLSAVRQAESAAQEAERRAKEERRRQRKQKKALQQAALAAALERHEGADFEGFPGSGNLSGQPHRGPGTFSSDDVSSTTREEFGPFEHGSRTSPYPDDLGEDGADFGGGFYANPRRLKSGSSSGGSDTHSRTSGVTSITDSAQYNHHYASQQRISPYGDPAPAHLHDSPRKKKSSRSSGHSASSTSQTNSISSPPPRYTTFPTIAEQVHHSVHSDNQGNFPSAGLGGGLRRKNSEAGVLLARRGDA